MKTTTPLLSEQRTTFVTRPVKASIVNNPAVMYDYQRKRPPWDVASEVDPQTLPPTEAERAGIGHVRWRKRRLKSPTVQSPVQRLRFSTKIFYSLGAMGTTMKHATIGTFLVIYYNRPWDGPGDRREMAAITLLAQAISAVGMSTPFGASLTPRPRTPAREIRTKTRPQVDALTTTIVLNR